MPVLAKIVKISLKSGFVPTTFKHAIMTPVLKMEGAKSIFSEYRPV